MALKLDVKNYRIWIEENDFFFQRFSEMKNLLFSFIEMNFERNNSVDEVAKNLWTAYNKCDEIDYEQYDLVLAYSILHFLDRYHRFTKSFLKLIDHKFLPLSYREIEILDVGTGPGPALFAISDIYDSIVQFANATNNNALAKLKIKCDYVEQSNGFRHWLHHFTEFVNGSNKKGIYWQVPYHHGTYNDFTNIEFNIRNNFYDKTYVTKKRFNIVVFSNFLTQEHQIEAWENQIRNCFRFLRNKGKMIAIGAKNGKYEKIYATLDEKLLSFDFSNKNNIDKCKKVNINQDYLIFDLSDKYGISLKDYYKNVYRLFEKYDSTQFFSEEIKKHFENFLSNKNGRPKKWTMQIYEKYARLKWYKFRQNNIA